MNDFSALILAAGEGKRMKSNTAKVVHKVCGREMINHVLDAALEAEAKSCACIIGHCADAVKNVIGEIETVYQHEQLGTGHAVMQAKEFIKKNRTIAVLSGDTPLITSDTLKKAFNSHNQNKNAVTVLTSVLDDPTGYGRIVRGKENEVLKIVEQKDADEKEKEIRETNSGMYFFDSEKLLTALDSIKNDNAQNEYYLTDAIEIIRNGGGRIGAYTVEDNTEIMGVNDRVQLAAAQKQMQRRINERLMRSGVTIIDPDNTFICKEAVIGTDTVIYPGTIIEGNTEIGSGVTVGHNCKIVNSKIGDFTDIMISVIIDSTVGENTHVGPYAYIRPGCSVGSECKVGDFVELKKAQIGDKTKLSHLTYVGDAEVGSGVNFGCGTVVVNYDGKYKYKTVIKDNAFIGCNSNLVSPVTVNEGAYIAAGSTITDEVPSRALAIARARQVIKENWNDRRKK